MLSSMLELGTSLRAVHGLKHVVFFSQGIDDRILGTQSLDDFALASELALSMNTNADRAADAVLALGKDGAGFGDAGLRQFLSNGLKRMACDSVTVHSVDVSGLRLGNEGSTGTVRGHALLNILSQETGGRLLENTNDLETALGEVGRSTRALYLLSFYPEKVSGPDQLHRLQVKVRRDGIQVVARPGYLEDKPFNRYSPMERQLQLASLLFHQSDGERSFTPPLYAAPFPASAGGLRIPVVAELPLQHLSADPAGAYQLEVYGFLVDPRGHFIDYFERHLSMRAAELRQGEVAAVKLLEQMSAPFGADYEVRLVARDAYGGATGIATLALSPPPPAGGSLALSTPAFGAAQRAVLPLWRTPGYHRDGEGPEGAGDDLPALLRGVDASPVPLPALRPGEVAEVCFRVFNLTLHPETGDPQIAMHFLLKGAVDEVKLTEIQLAGRPTQVRPGVFDVSLRFRLPALAAGDWRFEVNLSDGLSKQSASASAPLAVGI
jgi:hypothetical protein